jgi:hypothetical protein
LAALHCDTVKVQAVQRVAGWIWALAGLAVAIAWHSVQGLKPGAYFFRREQHSVELLKEGGFRSEAYHLGLEQQLPAACPRLVTKTFAGLMSR